MSTISNAPLLQDPDERPLTARSVIASALLGEDPPRLRVAQLVRIASAFGINENRARVALSRMASQAEVRSVNGEYELISPALLARQHRQSESRAAATRPWKGDWCVAIIGPHTAAPEQRAQRRRDLERARFAEFRDGVWVRPNNLRTLTIARADTLVTLSSDEPDHPLSFRQAVPRLWDLTAWSAKAERLQNRLRQLNPDDPVNLAPGFVLSASCLRHFQADPLLPVELLPADWPGTALRTDYTNWDRRYRRILRDSRAE
jgi:phenylacetic acid degradation operon negative regulatory protein